MIRRLTELFGMCLFGAVAGWTAVLAIREPAPPPATPLLVYGAVVSSGAGYLAGSALRGRRPGGLSLRAATVAAVAAVAAKSAVPSLAAWAAVLVAAAVFGAAAGLVRTR